MKQILFVVRARYYENYLTYDLSTGTLTHFGSVFGLFNNTQNILPVKTFFIHPTNSLFWKPKSNFLFIHIPSFLYDDLSFVINIANVRQLLQNTVVLPCKPTKTWKGVIPVRRGNWWKAWILLKLWLRIRTRKDLSTERIKRLSGHIAESFSNEIVQTLIRFSEAIRISVFFS